MSDDPFQVTDDVPDEQDNNTDPFGQPIQDSQPAADTGDSDPFGSAAPAGGDSDPFGSAAPAGGDSDPFASAAPAEETQQQQQPEDTQSLEHKDELAASNQETPLQKWQQQRREVLAKRKQDSEDAKKKLAEDAKAELAKFHQQREEAIQKTMAANRLDEQNVKKDFDLLMKSGTMWEKVGKLTNLQPKANEDRRVPRMRKLLVQLKNKNDSAE